MRDVYAQMTARSPEYLDAALRRRQPQYSERALAKAHYIHRHPDQVSPPTADQLFNHLRQD
jgi:hypothetical protein